MAETNQRKQTTSRLVNKSHNTNWDNQNWKLRLTETECLTLNNGQLK